MNLLVYFTYVAESNDFSATKKTLTLSEQHQCDTVSISIIDDDITESPECFEVKIDFSEEPNTKVLRDPSNATVVIYDNDIDEGKVVVIYE